MPDKKATHDWRGPDGKYLNKDDAAKLPDTHTQKEKRWSEKIKDKKDDSQLGATTGIEILYSTKPDRSRPRPLNGTRPYSTNIYIFIPSKGVSQVVFQLDNGPRRTEGKAPFDLIGTELSGNAKPLSTQALIPGNHTVKATINGKQNVTATFGVRGSAVTPAPDVPVVPTPDVPVIPTPDVPVTPTPDVPVIPDVPVTPTPDITILSPFDPVVDPDFDPLRPTFFNSLTGERTLMDSVAKADYNEYWAKGLKQKAGTYSPFAWPVNAKNNSTYGNGRHGERWMFAKRLVLGVTGDQRELEDTGDYWAAQWPLFQDKTWAANPDGTKGAADSRGTKVVYQNRTFEVGPDGFRNFVDGYESAENNTTKYRDLGSNNEMHMLWALSSRAFVFQLNAKVKSTRGHDFQLYANQSIEAVEETIAKWQKRRDYPPDKWIWTNHGSRQHFAGNLAFHRRMKRVYRMRGETAKALQHEAWEKLFNGPLLATDTHVAWDGVRGVAGGMVKVSTPKGEGYLWAGGAPDVTSRRGVCAHYSIYAEEFIGYFAGAMLDNGGDLAPLIKMARGFATYAVTIKDASTLTTTSRPIHNDVSGTTKDVGEGIGRLQSERQFTEYTREAPDMSKCSYMRFSLLMPFDDTGVLKPLFEKVYSLNNITIQIPSVKVFAAGYKALLP